MRPDTDDIPPAGVSAFENFHDAVRVNADIVSRVRKIVENETILARAKIPRGLEIVLRPVAQSNHERTEKLALHDFPNLLNFHVGKFARRAGTNKVVSGWDKGVPEARKKLAGGEAQRNHRTHHPNPPLRPSGAREPCAPTDTTRLRDASSFALSPGLLALCRGASRLGDGAMSEITGIELHC